MDEFIENFQKFREWLYCEYYPNMSGTHTLGEIQEKFEELGLKNVF